MNAPDKMHIGRCDPSLERGFATGSVEKMKPDDIEYIRKGSLLEWLAERKKYYQGLIPAEGAVAFICALDEVKHKIESI